MDEFNPRIRIWMRDKKGQFQFLAESPAQEDPMGEEGDKFIVWDEDDVRQLVTYLSFLIENET